MSFFSPAVVCLTHRDFLHKYAGGHGFQHAFGKSAGLQEIAELSRKSYRRKSVILEKINQWFLGETL